MAGLIREQIAIYSGEGRIGECNDMWTNVPIVRLEMGVRRSKGDRLEFYK